MNRLRERVAVWDGGIPQESRGIRVPAYRVGEPLRQGQTDWPDGSRYGFGPSGHELVLFRTDIDGDLEDAVGRGPCEFALVVEAPLIVLAYQFGKVVSWETAPFAWHLQPAERRFVPPADVPGGRALLNLSLVGSDDGIIRAQRNVTLGPELTWALHRAIRSQARQPFDSEAYVRAVGTLYLRHPSAAAMLDYAEARSPGNG
jgi:hypothetical protein